MSRRLGNASLGLLSHLLWGAKQQRGCGAHVTVDADLAAILLLQPRQIDLVYKDSVRTLVEDEVKAIGPVAAGVEKNLAAERVLPVVKNLYVRGMHEFLIEFPRDAGAAGHGAGTINNV